MKTLTQYEVIGETLDTLEKNDPALMCIKKFKDRAQIQFLSHEMQALTLKCVK